MSKFVHLNCHSEYSITDGILRLKQFISKVKKLGMQSVALTDQSNLFAMVKFYKTALSMGIKPIIGCDVWLADNNEHSERLTLLCQNNLGLNNLMLLISKSYNNWHNGKPIVDKNWLKVDDLHAGLIAIAPMIDSDIGRLIVTNNLSQAADLTKEWMKLFKDRFYIAINRLSRATEEIHIKQILQLVGQDIPLVATGEVRFLEAEDFMAHEARVCINQGVRLEDSHRKKNYSNLQYLRDGKEMQEVFADLKEALINTVEIAKRCNVNLDLGKTYLPKYQTPNNSSEQEYLTISAQNGLIKRLNYNNYLEIPEQYTDRLNAELLVINSMGFAGYFLIVSDIIQWSLKSGIPVGPGRGSGAGSLVAFALHITNIDPLIYGLLFERFLNPERVSMPDFDIDFCIKGRDLVIGYVAEKYGKDSVAQIITYGTMAAKAAIRDVGRVLGSPYGFVDQIAKLVPLDLGMTIDKALEQEIILKTKYEEDEEVKSIIDLAKKLEGITRNVGKHAGGLVISPIPIVNFSPLYREANNVPPVTQFDKNDIEDIGLVKFDFLGLKTLTIIDLAVKAINGKIQQSEDRLNIDTIPLDDTATFDFLCEGNTTAVFQLESRGMRELTIKLQPNCFEDLIAIGALYRPGPLQSGMVDDFINRKRGKETIQYPHQELVPILQSTYGVIVYQEQVMQIAQILAGYTLGAADLLRRAMGKKKPEEMAKQRQIFIDGVCNLDVSRTDALKLGSNNADNIFNLIDKFAGYGFNKSHAAGYALITYQTAWLKTHYPAEFMSAVLSLDLANTDKIIGFIVDCRKIGITIHEPNINNCQYHFIATSSNTINYGLGAIKGIGEASIDHILDVRKNGNFIDLLDLCIRVDLHKVSRKTLEALIKAGALDCFKLHRAALLYYLENTIKIAFKAQNRCHKQLDMFADYYGGESNIQLEFVPTVCSEWDNQELLLAEKEALGFYFSDHPLGEFQKELIKLGVIKFSQAKLEKSLQKFAGCIVAIRLSRTKRGDKMAFVTVDDSITRQEIVVFSDLYQQNKELLKKDQLIVIEGEVTQDNYTGGFKIKCNKISDFHEICKNLSHNITIILNLEINDAIVVAQKIKEIITPHPGDCPLILHYRKSGMLTKMKLGLNWKVNPVKQLLLDLKNLAEVQDAYIE
jgi:DNA polymerase-3 subunit alpha